MFGIKRPKRIIDVNGKHNTVYVNDDNGVAENNKARIAGTSVAAPSASSLDKPFSFRPFKTVHADEGRIELGQISSALEMYALDLDDYANQFDSGDPYEVIFEDGDMEGFESLQEEAGKWREALIEFGETVIRVQDKVPDEPESDSMKEWSEYLMELKGGWDFAAQIRGTTLSSNETLDSKTGAATAAEIREKSPMINLDGTSYYLL